MKNIKKMEINSKSVVESLSGASSEIIEYLPYLLQDLWELGGGTDELLEMLEKNTGTIKSNDKVLDLCCGKGVVLINLAKKYKCGGVGIDLFEPFIIEAKEKAVQNQVKHQIKFEVMDIKDAIKCFSGYDVVIYGGDTDVLGTEIESLQKVVSCCKSKGYIIYESASDSLEEVFKSVKKTGLQIIDQSVMQKENIVNINNYNNNKIKQRADELIERFPLKKTLFENYVISQVKESYELENNLIWFRFLLQCG